jgi:hypothetical protein
MNRQRKPMKQELASRKQVLRGMLLALLALAFVAFKAGAQDSTAAPAPRKPKPVKNTFQSQWIIDDQTVLVPVQGTLEMDFQHRFGTVQNGYQDFWGFFSPTFNARFGGTYTVIKNLSVGIGFAKTGLLWDGNAKYSLFTQTPGKYPVSLTFYGDMAVNTFKDATLYDGTDIQHTSDRFTFYTSAIIARKVNEKLSVQLTASVSHQNAVSGYYTKIDTTGNQIYESMHHNHFALAFSARYKFTEVTSVIFDYDQPVTKHPDFNPNPNLALGVEFNTSGHCFQIFFTNFTLLNPQNNNMWNHNSPFSYTDKATGNNISGGQWSIGFNLTRLWNY